MYSKGHTLKPESRSLQAAWFLVYNYFSLKTKQKKEIFKLRCLISTFSKLFDEYKYCCLY